MRPLAFTAAFAALVSIAFSAEIKTIAGTGAKGSAGDGGPAAAAQIDNPFGIIRGPDGALWFCEYTGQRIRRIAPDGTLATIAGTGAKGHTGDGGPASQATFNLPHELRFDAAGDLFIVDMANHAIRKIDMKTRIITTLAGTGTAGYSGDGGPAAKAQFKQPHSLQFGPDGSLYICDIGNHVIRRIDMKTGLISTFAGTGRPGPTPDRAPIAGTPLNGPRSLDFDRAGHLWLATREGNQVFKLDLTAARIHHIAGTGKSGFTGNGGPAREATLSGPKGIALDAAGHAWIADCESHTIRKIDPATGTITLAAGTGQKGDAAQSDAENGGTDPLRCRLARPHGIFVDRDGAVFIGDSENHRIRILRPGK